MDNLHSSVEYHAAIFLYWNQLAEYIQYLILYMLHVYHVKETSFPNNLPPETFPLGNNFISNFWLSLNESKYWSLAILHLVFTVLGVVQKEPKLKASRNGHI